MLFTEKELEDAKPLNKFFDENGFSSCNFIVNMGSTFIFFMFYAGILIFTFIMKLMAYLCGTQLGFIKKAANWLEKQFLWNAIFRFVLQQYPPLTISGLINIIWVSYSD
jgi:hypothetical protein